MHDIDRRGLVDRLGDRVLAAAAPVARWFRTPGRVAVLAFHEVPDPQRFATHLDHLARAYTVVGLEEVAAAAGDGGGLPRGAVALTFDDGHRSVYEHAFPQLRARGWPATVFVVAGLIGTQEPFWWDELTGLLAAGATAPGLPDDPREALRLLKTVPDEQRRRALDSLRRVAPTAVRQPQLTWSEVREMAQGGITIGNHSLSHPCLPRCDDDVIEAELRGAHEVLTDRLERRPRTLAYPNGDADDRVRRVARNLGYELGLLFDHRLASPGGGDPLRTSRIRTDAAAPPERFRALVSGTHPGLHRLRGRD